MPDADKKRCELEQEVLCQYSDGKISEGRAAEILGISLREWYDLLERKGVPIKWDDNAFSDAGEATFGD
jgi:predicted HTH domain antitoxin